MKKRIALLFLIGSYTIATYSVSNDTLTVAMVGDIMMGTTFPTTQLPPHNGAELFKDATPILKRADIAVGNLEGTLCDGGTSTKGTGPNSYAFRTPTSYAPWLTQAGFDFLSMANNHANDFGIEGIMSTEQYLREQGIKYCGIQGRTETAVIERKGLKIGFCAFGHNSYTLKHTDLSTVSRILNDLKSRTDLIIVSFHGGAEGRTKSHLPYGTETFLGENRGSLRELAHYCIDNGADIVYGHGPHVVRAVEVYNDRFIVYSLGNFCTPYGMSLTDISAYAPIIEVKIARDGHFLNGQIHSLKQIKGIGPRTDSQHSAARQMKQLSEEDVPKSEATIDAKGSIRQK
jgi:poly-gamma-glutamate capsule biosynthesis protein CapA/YwtB (metallophosphatase superfamily)